MRGEWPHFFRRPVAQAVLCGGCACILSLGCSDDIIRVGEAGPPTVGTVDSLLLLDAATAEEIAGLSERTTWSVAELASEELSIRAVVSGPVASVAFSFDGNEALEVAEPFTYPGDVDGNLQSFRAEIGRHRVTATPYSSPGAEGRRGKSTSIELIFTE